MDSLALENEGLEWDGVGWGGMGGNGWKVSHEHTGVTGYCVGSIQKSFVA